MEVKITDYARKGTSFLFIIDFNGTRGLVMTPEEAAGNAVYFKSGNFKNYTDENFTRSLFSFSLKPVNFEQYRKAFDTVMMHLVRGDTYLLNLTFPTPVESNRSLNDLFFIGNSKYKILVSDRFTCFSPESFIKITGNRIFSFPMKGTIDAAIPQAEKEILADRKEFYEHNTIVDLIRNDLSMVSENVRVNRFRYIDRITTNRKELLQVSSEISGELPDDYCSRLGEIIFTLLPAGSVTGAPKERTVQIIRETEIYERGYYTGIFGYFDGMNLDSAVMIRFIENTSSGLICKSGGGITAMSDTISEYEEMIQKVYVPVI
jgi:para-aminobenzoate synthetase component 1